MGDKKLMAIQSVNGYSNQLTTSNILANSPAIYRLQPKGIDYGHSRLAE
jgi:hypothetical protein